MVGTRRRSRWADVGHATVIGLAFAPFALLFAVWIPSLALVFGSAAVAAGCFDVRWSSGRRTRFALLAVGSGLLAIMLTMIVVVVTTTGPQRETGVIVVGPP